MSGLPHDPRIDDVDWALITVLQEDGRASYAKLAERVGLSPAAVRNRVTRLLETGTVKVHVNVDPLHFGDRTFALVRLRCTGDLEPALRLIAKLDEVNFGALTSGVWAVTFEVVCAGSEHLLEVIDQFRATEGVTEVAVDVIHKYLKIEQMALRG
jgi:Lrp/AsnC family transcriptional regulator for asnA, asnC and gidA